MNFVKHETMHEVTFFGSLSIGLYSVCGREKSGCLVETR